MREKWQGVKHTKRDFQPNFTKMRDIKGNRAKHGQEADAKAEYLAEVQWKENEKGPPKVNPPKLIQHPLGIKEDKTTMKELRTILKKFKNHKAPGPDRVTVEMFKQLTINNLDIVLHMLNECWENERIPQCMTEANVASLFKKGDTQNLANYRPISLLNCTYKLYASIIQKRLADKTDKHIHPTQYGFRAKRSTAQALYLARRIQDIAEQSGEQILLVLLDWEKAFDKIDQTRMIEALERLNIPAKMIENIKAIYDNPQFRVVGKENTSEYRQQKTGIRQGCPLSPYLFILVMTVMFADIKNRTRHRLFTASRRRGAIDGLGFTEILYADDTLLVLKDDKTASLLL